MIELDIRNKRDLDLSPDLAQGFGSATIGDGQADDLTTRILQSPDLGNGSHDVTRVCLGHGLDGDRRSPTDQDAANPYLPGLPSWKGNRILAVHTPILADLRFMVYFIKRGRPIR